MMLINKKRLVVTLGLLVLLVGIPLLLTALSNKQETRSRAETPATLSFDPVSTTSTPIQKNVGDTFSLDLIVDPGTHLATFVRFQVTFDPTKVQLDTNNPFTLNTAAFPTKIEGPVVALSTLAESVSIGADPTKAIQKPTKVGTINFKAIASTNGTPTLVSFNNISQVLSSGQTDEAAQNVLSTTTPANIQIGGGGGVIQPSLSGTLLSFTVFLHGIGAAGDNPNPTGNSLSNKNPLHPQRNLTVEVFNSDNQVVATSSAPVAFDPGNGNFTGKVGLGETFPTGHYYLKIKTDRYLKKIVPGVQQITTLQDNAVAPTTLVAGDVNGDNTLNIIDYNALLDCGYGLLTPLPMADPNSVANSAVCKAHDPVENVDIDDNGVINSFDYNLFLRELSVQSGD